MRHFEYINPIRQAHAWSSGGSRGFSQTFHQGQAQSGESCFLPLEIEKTIFLAYNFKILEGKTLPCPAVRHPLAQMMYNEFSAEKSLIFPSISVSISNVCFSQHQG